MSEQEKINIFEKIKESAIRAQYQMLERKIKLGESVVLSDTNGNPIVMSAEEALKRFKER